MAGYYFLSFILGSIVVFQPSLNRLFSEEHGLIKAAITNMTVGLIFAGIFFFMIFSLPERFPSILQFKTGGSFRWWYVVPGLLGLTLVMGVPISMRHIGAFPTIIAMLIGQILTSFFLDAIMAGQSVNIARLGGLGLIIVGAYLSFKPN